MRHPLRAASALLLCTALSSAAIAAPSAAPVQPAAAPSIPTSTPAAKPAAPVHVVHARSLAHRTALRRHLALVHRRPAPVRMAALDMLPPPRPARLVDMTTARDGVFVHPDTVQVAKPVAQNSACDSLLCSSYIILGAGF